MWHGRARAQPHWVRSHCTAEAFAAEFPGQMWRRDLNAKADALAGSRALAACTPHFVRKVRELDQVVREVNCFLASRAEKLIKNKFQEFVPRAVRASLAHFEKPRPPARSFYVNKRQHLLRLVDRSEHGHSWQVSSPQGAANLQLTCETCKLWVQQTYSQADFHRVVTHPCVMRVLHIGHSFTVLMSCDPRAKLGPAWAVSRLLGLPVKPSKLPCSCHAGQLAASLA